MWFNVCSGTIRGAATERVFRAPRSKLNITFGSCSSTALVALPGVLISGRDVSTLRLNLKSVGFDTCSHTVGLLITVAARHCFSRVGGAFVGYPGAAFP